MVGGGISIFDESSSRLSFFTPRPRIRNQFMCVWGGVRRAKLIMLALALSWRPRRTSNVSPPITITKAAANLIIIETHAHAQHTCVRVCLSLPCMQLVRQSILGARTFHKPGGVHELLRQLPSFAQKFMRTALIK